MPIKTIQDKRLAYLVSLESVYKEQGYTTRLDGFRNILEIYEKGVMLPKSNDEVTIERWGF